MFQTRRSLIFAHCWRCVPVHRSKVTVRKATADVYAATIDDRVAMKIGSGDWSPSSTGLRLQGRDMKLAVSGPNFAVWELKE